MKSTVGAVLAVIALGSAGAAAAEQNAPSPSPFIQCDGQTGHVGAGESLLRLLAVTATAGLSEAAMRRDNPAGRLSGAAGAEACDRALGADDNPFRRARLGFARTIHYLEAGRADDAVRSARDYPAQIGARGEEWGIARTLGSAAASLEAEALLRAGRIEEAEDAAVRAANAAGLEIVGLNRTAPYLFLTPRLGDAKRQVLERIARLLPDHLVVLAHMQSFAGDHRAAAATFGAFVDSLQAALPPDSPRIPDMLAMRAVFTGLAGDVAEARRQAAGAQAELAAGLGAGVVSETQRATAEELLALVQVIGHAAEGRMTEARRFFSGRGEWLLTPRAVIVTLMERLEAGIEAGERNGLLARAPAEVRDETFTNYANRLRNPERLRGLYAWAAYQALDSDYRGDARRAWQLSPRPAFLVRNNATAGWPEGSRFEALSATANATGSLADGEALLLHAALIARSRGLTGFAVVLGRTHTTEMRLRFGNIGEPGFPAQATLDAGQVIAALAPHVPEPTRH
jgi:hypothetical protein